MKPEEDEWGLGTCENCGLDGQTSSANLPTLTQEEAGKMLNVSPRTIRNIKRIEREAPDQIEKIMSGKIQIHRVSKINVQRGLKLICCVCGNPTSYIHTSRLKPYEVAA